MSAARMSQLHKLASDWEPELYAEMQQKPPAKFLPGLRTPCVNTADGMRCVPGAYLLGNWQSNPKGLGILTSSHPNITEVGNHRCWAHHTNDKGGRTWLRQTPAAGFDPKHHLMAALGCVTALTFYPGFAGRYHKYWEQSYWPCKAACQSNRTCWRSYFEPHGQVWPCKAAALAQHDRAVHLAPTATEGALDVTPPYLMRAFYGTNVKLIATVRNPTDRLRHAFYSHPHYARKYGKGSAGLLTYAREQTAGWYACARAFGAKRCAIFFEQLGQEPNDVFFHCDQLLRGLYAPYIADWLAAFPEGALLLVRTEDLIDQRRLTLQRVWRHLGVPPLDWDAADAGTIHLPARLRRAEARFPVSYGEWTKAQGPISPEATETLQALYAPHNRALRDMLAASGGPSCGGAAEAQGAPPCDAFLFEQAMD